MNKLILSAVFMGMFFICSCAGVSGGKSNVDPLNQKEFALVGVAGGEDIFIGFDNGKVYGFSGINRYIGSYKITGDKIEFSGMGSTMMAGPEDKTIIEAKYLESLNNADSFSLDGDTLRLGSLEYKLK